MGKREKLLFFGNVAADLIIYYYEPGILDREIRHVLWRHMTVIKDHYDRRSKLKFVLLSNLFMT